MPSLNATLPILSTEGPMPGLSPNQAVYFLNIDDGKIYAFNGDSALRNRTTPVWVSNFVCSKRPGAQQQVRGS